MQAPLKMRDPSHPTRKLSFNIRMIIFCYVAFIEPITMQNFIKKDFACQMPNLAHFWHFPMVADRAVVIIIKDDEPCKTFSKLV